MTTRSYGGYVMVDNQHMDKHVPTKRQYQPSEDTDFTPKSKSIAARTYQRIDVSTLPTEANSSKRNSITSQRDTIPDKYSRDVNPYIECSSGHKSVHNNDLSRRHSLQSSENDIKAHNNTTSRRRSSKHYENGNADHTSGSSQRHSARHYADTTVGNTNNLSQRGPSRHHYDDVAEHSSSTSHRHSSRHYENSIADHSNDSSRRRTSRHYEDNITDHSKDTPQRHSSRHYENSIRDHSNDRSHRRHSRHHEDGYTDHSNDSSRSRSSKHHEDDMTDRSHSSRRRSLNHYEDDIGCRITDSSRKHSTRHYEQYKEDIADQTNKYSSLRANQISDRTNLGTDRTNHVSDRANHVSDRANHVSDRVNHISDRTNHVSDRVNHISDRTNHISDRANHINDRTGYATLPSSTKLDKSERRDGRVHGARVTERTDKHVGVVLHEKTDTLSKARANHGFSHHEYDNYSSLPRNADSTQLHTSSLQRHPRKRDRVISKSEQPYQRGHSMERDDKRDSHHDLHDMRRNSSQFSGPASDIVVNEQYVSYQLNKQSKIHNNVNNKGDKADIRRVKEELPREQDKHLPYGSNNDPADDHKRRKPYRYQQGNVGRSSSQNFLDENEIIGIYASNKDEHIATRRRSSSATRNEGHQRGTHSEASYTSQSKSHTTCRSSKDRLDKEEGDRLFRLTEPQNSSDTSKSKQPSGSEQKLNKAAPNSHKNSYSGVKHNGMTNDVAGNVSTHTTSKDATDVEVTEERKRQHKSPCNDRLRSEVGQLVSDSHVSHSLTNGSRNCSQTCAESIGRARVSTSSNRGSTSTVDKHEEVGISSYRQDISYIRRPSSSRPNDNTGFASSSSPRREDSKYKLSGDVSSLTHTQDKYHRSREESRHQKRPQTGTFSDHNVLTAALPKQQSSSPTGGCTREESYTDRTHFADSTTEYNNGELRGGRKDITASNKHRTQANRGENAEVETVFPNADIKPSIVVSPGSSSVSIINKNDSPKSSSKVDLIEVSSSTSTLKDSCVTSKTSITDSISSFLGRNNKYQQFQSNQPEGPSLPISISDKWRKLTRSILPDKDDVSDNVKERKAPVTIFYAAAARFMSTLSSVHNALPKGTQISAAQPEIEISSSHVPQSDSVTSETQVEEHAISEAKSELNLSPPNTLSLQENTDKVSPSHSIVSLEVPKLVESQRPSIISTAGNLSSHKMRISAYALMTEKTGDTGSEMGNHTTPAVFDADMKRRSKDADTELTSFLPAEMSRREEKFHEAARVNDADSIRTLLKEKVNINCRNSLDRTALHWASANGNLETAEILIEHGADLEAKDKYGMRAVLWAAWFGHVSVLKALINAGANTRVVNKQGLGILHCAAENNHVSVISFTVEALENYEVNLKDKNERTPLHSAAEGGHVEAVTRLLEAKADVHKKDKAGMTAVHLSVKCGHVEVLKALLLQGFEVDDRDVDGKTALHLAAEGGHKEAVDLLLDYTANPNSETVKEVTPLHLAAQEGHVEVCRSLVKYGLNVNAQNFQGNSALHIAANGNHKEVARILIDAKCEMDLPNNISNVMFSADADVMHTFSFCNTIHQRMQTPLHIAVESGHLDVVQVLLAGGASLDTREKSGKSALQLAARGNYVTVVDMLIKAERYYANAREYHDKDVGYVDPDTYLRNPQHPHAAQMKDVLWKLATKQLKPNDWKKLAYHWRFTPDHVKAIEQEYTGTTSYKEHSYRLLNIWLHGVRKDENVLKLLYEALVAIDRKHLAESVRRKVNLQAEKPCSPSICTLS